MEYGDVEEEELPMNSAQKWTVEMHKKGRHHSGAQTVTWSFLLKQIPPQ